MNIFKLKSKKAKIKINKTYITDKQLNFCINNINSTYIEVLIIKQWILSAQHKLDLHQIIFPFQK
ncbi:hypothetical protein BHC46_06150 [Snodgrassella alvi]|uniref:Uncharacterized protein n=1 Tax=Snodgrassella alvi TaxID=1196083 RepID=A0A2N9XHQ5_9NEIS|nr:hypothetical protein BGI31_04400 [Snodgrassella communis]PIT47860.1 hypothetical protein BHC46_06150 [Snodgrassella alvi]PIT52786.1 hypothetical protein BHC48_01580 [Snodgrassella communis]